MTKHFQYLPKLQTLYLHASARPVFGDEDLQSLTGTALQVLSMNSDQFDFSSGRYFDLSGTRVTDEGLKALCGNTQIQQLDLSGSRITNEGLQSLRCLPKLEFLSLRGLALNDSGVRRLAGLPYLEVLDVQRSTLSNSGLLTLQTSATLQDVFAAGTPVTQPVVRRVGKTLEVNFHDHGDIPPTTWQSLSR